MADVTKTAGGVGTEGVLQHFGGTGLACFGMIIKNGSAEAVDMQNEGDVTEAWESIVQAIEEKATLVIWQYEDDTTGAASIALEQTGAAWTAAALQTAIRALGTTVGANSVDVSGTTVTDVGFKLAVA